MKLRIIYIILLSIIAWMPLRSQSELDPFLIEAGHHNPQLQARFNEYLAALEKIPQVTLPDPQLAMAYFLQPVETRMGPQKFKLSVSQLFPWFGSLKATQTQLAEEAKSKLEVFEETKSRLHHEIRSSFYSIYLAKKTLIITRENQEILDSFRQLVMVKIENGKSSSLDDIRLAIELGDLENQVALLVDHLDVQWKIFDNLVNSPSGNRPNIPKELINHDLPIGKEAIKDSIIIRNHKLLKLDMEISSMLARKQVASLSGNPNFSVGFDYIAVGQGENNLPGQDAFIFPKIGITIPIYRNKYKARVQEVAYQEIAKGYEKTNEMKLLENLLESVWKDYQDAIRRIALYEIQYELTNNALDLMEVDFAANRSPFEEILRMDRKLLSYALQVEKAKTDKYVAISYLNYLMGK